MKKPIFEINEANGKCYRIWANGNVEGFDADGAVVLNGIIPALDYLAGLAIKSGGDAADKAKAFLREDGLLRE